VAIEDRDLTVEDQRGRLEPRHGGGEIGEAPGEVPAVP
jgi:hypothetical protein